jgi:hypothetical protein
MSTAERLAYFEPAPTPDPTRPEVMHRLHWRFVLGETRKSG